MGLKGKIRKCTPNFLVSVYHYLFARFAALWYRHPSCQMRVIGITGTSGKSTTIFLLRRILEEAGYTVGSTSTIDFKIGHIETLNTKKMTMLGRFATQKLLRDMVQAGCQYAIVETTSEGIKQFRHIGIEYDVVVLTNLYPEHIESHGGFENYKKAKEKLFAHLSHTQRKSILKNKKKILVVNGDNEYVKDFLQYTADEKWMFGLGNLEQPNTRSVQGSEVEIGNRGVSWRASGKKYTLGLRGAHNVMNGICALTIALSEGIDEAVIQKTFENIHAISGRIEFIDEGQEYTVIVDYAFEPVALESLYAVVETIPYKRVIHVLGATGGGRDTARRSILGGIAGERADIVVVTDEDPYDEDPLAIMYAVAAGAKEKGKEEGKDLYTIPDRKKAIQYAIAQAKEGDLVLITGKGSEQAMCVAGGKKIPWDDRRVVREAIQQTI